MELMSKTTLVTVLTILILTPGCKAQNELNDSEKMYDLASDLKDIASGVDGVVKYGDGRSLSETELLLESVNNNEKRLEKFSDFQLRVKVEGNNSAVLLCQDDIALIEDSGCTAESDLQSWNDDITRSCDFSLNLKKICR